jgi:uncharacterized membrane protein
MSKVWGIIGSVFLAFNFMPSLSPFFTIFGYVSLGIALAFYSEDNEKIFNYFLIGAMLSFIASVLFYFKLFAVLTSLIFSVFSSNPLIPITFSVVLYFGVYYIFLVLSAVYFQKSFSILSETTNNRYFKLGGNFLIAGAVLSIFAIGFIITVIGWILVLIGFVTLEEIVDAEIIEQEKLPKN